MRWLLFLILSAVTVRSLLVAPFSVPSESMMPRLLAGDYLIAAKWPYGWSRHSFPFSLPPFSGRIGGEPPRRGDVVLFRTPTNDRIDYVKRLIGLPGDRIGISRGSLVLNGVRIPRLRVADFLLPVGPATPCPTVPERSTRAGHPPVCRYARYRETLPGGRSYDVIGSNGGDMAETVVPAGHYFMMGDNRDRSADSRWPIAGGRGIGMVPADNLVARASWLFFSTDGTGGWWRPWTWGPATRWARIGEPLQPAG